jgi:hypothetical protein
MHFKHLSDLAGSAFRRQLAAGDPRSSSHRYVVVRRRRILGIAAPLASIVFLVCAFATPSFAAQYYAAPNGTSTGDGSIGRPWSLATALSRTSIVKPGDIIWLRGGTYGTGGGTLFTSSLNGNASAPVIVRQYQGEHARVDGGIKANGTYTWFWGFEITNTDPNRYVTDINNGRQPGLYLYGKGNKAINLIIDNVGRAAVGFWSNVNPGSDNEVYGCIMWGNGIYDSGTTRGDSIYANLADPNPTLAKISDTISFRNFNYGIKGWSEWSSRYLNNFQLVNNVSFDNGTSYDVEVADSVHGMNGLQLVNNFIYQPPSEQRNCTRFGTSGIKGGAAEVRNNYFACGTIGWGALYLNGFSTVTVTGNTFVSPNKFTNWNPPSAPASLTWNSNKYYGGGNTSFKKSGVSYTMAGWKSATGFDSTSTYSSAYPTQTRVFVLPNKYEAGRAHVAVYNWGRLSSVNADLSTVLKVGDLYEVRDAQNYWGKAVASGTYNGGAVSLPTILSEVSPIPGLTHFVNNHTDMEFNVYVVIKK